MELSLIQAVWWNPVPALSPLASASVPPSSLHLSRQPSGTRMGQGLTWQDLAEEPFPHGQLDVGLVEAWLEGDGAECALQRPGLLGLCSRGDSSHWWRSCLTICKSSQAVTAQETALNTPIISSPPPSSQRTCLLPGTGNSLY